MNTNTVRYHLHQYYANKKTIEQIKSDLEEYRKMDGMKAQVLTGMPGVHSNESKTESTALDNLERWDYVLSLENDLDRLMRINRAIESIYFYLKEPARSVIELRYFITPTPEDVRQRKCNWAEIAEEVNYSEDYCKEVEGKVIKRIQAKILGVK